jgi:hypothetical protein
MTLKNAQRRFGEMGFECVRDVPPYRYKYRRIGTVAWRRSSDLYAMLEAARAEYQRTLQEAA